MRHICWTICALLAVLLVGCRSRQTNPSGSWPPGGAASLRAAARRILDSERFPEPTEHGKRTIEQRIKKLLAAPRYESAKVGLPSRTSQYRISCGILAEFGRSAIPFLLKAFDYERPTANLYFALALQRINPRIAGTMWRAMEGDHRNVPCMKGRDFYAATVAEIAHLRGEIPARETARE